MVVPEQSVSHPFELLHSSALCVNQGQGLPQRMAPSKYLLSYSPLAGAMPKLERILPAPDAFATCPAEGKVLEYYEGIFEAGYLLLHPFIKPVSREKEQFKPGARSTRASIAKNGVAVSWQEAAARAGLPSIAAVDIGLRSMILGLEKELSNQEYTSKIESLVESDGVLPPPEGCFSDLLHDRVLTYIQELGHEWVWVGDDFGTERRLYWIEDLKGRDADITRNCRNIFTIDKSVLWTTHWESHFSFLCSSKNNLANVQRFEGFFCTPQTEVYWSVRS